MTTRSAARAPDAQHIELLQRRAAALGRVPRAEHEADSFPAVLFQLSDEQYAVAASIVLEAAVLRELTPLPGARAPLFGVTHWRGQLLLILDLREQLRVRARGVTDLSRIIVIEGHDHPFGLLADAAREVIEVEHSAIRPLPVGEEHSSLIRGMVGDGVLVIDENTLLRIHGVAAPDHEGRGG